METAPIAECRLDLPGLRAQRDRCWVLGEHVAEVRRTSRRLDVRFDGGVDEALLTETIAVERECCPFFELDYNATSRWLAIGVKQGDQDPALDAIRAALESRAMPPPASRIV